jgi:hypothetical protein
MFGEGWLLQTLLPGHQGARIFTLWSGSSRQDQQVLAQTRGILCTGGIVSGHPTAMMDPYILQENVPRHMLSKFERWSLKAEGWINIIQEAVLYDCVVQDEDDNSDSREKEFALGQESEKEESSTIASEMDEGDKASAFDFQWAETPDELDMEGSPTASAHRTALELLGRFIIASTKSTAMEF